MPHRYLFDDQRFYFYISHAVKVYWYQELSNTCLGIILTGWVKRYFTDFLVAVIGTVGRECEAYLLRSKSPCGRHMSKPQRDGLYIDIL